MKKHYMISPHLIRGTISSGFILGGIKVSRKALRRYKPTVQAVRFTPTKPAIILNCSGTINIDFIVRKQDLLDPCLFDGLADCINNKDFDLQAFVHELINDQLLKAKIGGRHGSRLIHNEIA